MALAAMPVGTVLATTSTLVVLLAALGIALRRAGQPRGTVAVAVVAAGSSLLATFGSGEPANQSLSSWLLMECALLLCVLVQAVRRTRGPGTLLSAGTVTSAIVLAPLRLASGPRASPGVASAGEWCVACGLLAACAIAVGLYLRSLDEVREESIHAARREQRLRLASDLHDWLGHEVTGLVLEAQAARINDREPGEVRRALERIEEAGVRVLDSVDRALCWLRADDRTAGMLEWERSATVSDIPALVNRFEAFGSVRVELDLDDQVRDVRPEITRTVHRIVLEALTNVRRHAPAARQVSVAVRRNGAHVIVRVVNDGVRRQGLLKRARGGGSGLQGLAERAIALGGTSWAGPMGQAGWAVHAVLPVVS
ncbi:hypothetical protein GCM10017786_35640 [Amycolatopsis deserti]|uniref:histidine kinase n=1 Tax=Amycolatopsis deserti TaxID=185696 RepID=A0ABQ3J2P2_9PSEU|nr:hypothetical protein GCM10017786_35640 [Amycolatopsis deserti]